MEEYEDTSFVQMSEEEKIELWKAQQLAKWEIDGEALAILLSWDVDLHEVEHILFRDDKRTECTVEQLLLILEPLPV